jgi:hypothetical protein
MKTIYSFITVALICTHPAKSQFTMLQQYHEPSAAANHNKADMQRYDSLGALNNSTGQSQTWDFSAMQITSEVNTLSFMLPNMQTQDSVFAGATLKGQSNNNTFTYYKSDTVAKTFELIGIMSGASKSIFSDGKVMLKFPVNYASTYQDNYAFTLDTINGTGNYSVTATGSGDLKLVGGKVFSKTLQLTAWDQMTMATTAQTATVTNKDYIYFHEDNRYPLLRVSYSKTQLATITVSNSATVWVNWLEAVGLTENNFAASYAIYPNPATTQFAVRLNNNDGANCEISITRTTGELVKKVDLGSSLSIDAMVEVGDLAKGLYLVTTKAGNRVGTRKLIVE